MSSTTMRTTTTNTSETDKTDNMNDIQSLQKTEKELLDDLETNPNITPDVRQQLIDKINAISTMRMNLYKSLNQTTNLYESNLEQSQNILVQQNTAIDIEEKNLNENKKRLKALQDRNLQELRLVEINHYYGEKYSEHTKIAYGLILLFVGLIIINFLYKSGILPNPIYWALVILLTGYLAYRFWTTLFLAYRRNNMVYDQLDFASPPASSTTSSSSSSSSSGTTSDPWYKAPTSCVGSACCTSGMIFDASMNMCVVSASDSTTTTAVEGFKRGKLDYSLYH